VVGYTLYKHSKLKKNSTQSEENDETGQLEAIINSIVNKQIIEQKASTTTNIEKEPNTPPNIEQILLNALDYGDEYKTLVEKTEKEFEKLQKDYKENLKRY
jgi:hypothetical protein